MTATWAAAAGLDLPHRPAKPRRTGLTMVIDNGMPHGMFADAVSSAAPYIDIVKFGWGTALVTEHLESKIECLHDHGIRFSFGGTLFEKFVLQGRFESFLRVCRYFRSDLVEISNGTIPMSVTEKAKYIRRCAEEFPVVSEVGFKDEHRSEQLSSQQWIDAVRLDLDAGAQLVITEARESGKSGMCHSDGTVRQGLIESILASGVDADDLLFEAPTKALQTHFVTLLGPNVNLGNVAPTEVLGLETLRLGLRSDTLMQFEAAQICA
jgi:phosphosulfolactate synthase